VRELDDRIGAQRRVAIGEPLVERVFGAKLFGKRRARQRGKGEEAFDVLVIQPGNLDLNAANPARLLEEVPKIAHADQVNLVDAEAGRLLGMRRQRRCVEELVIADDPGPVEALLLPDELAVHDAHHLQLDMGRADEVAVDFAFEVAQRIGEMRERIPPPQGLAVASLFIAVPDDFPREVFQRPLGEDALTRPRVTQLLRDLDVLWHLEVVDLKELAIGPDDGEAVTPRQLPGVASNRAVERFDGHGQS
jgi:hypothetical protein